MSDSKVSDAAYPLVSGGINFADGSKPKSSRGGSIGLSLTVGAFIIAVAYADSHSYSIPLT